MSKHGSTKEKILKLIPEGKTNLSGISEALGLAPSTVSKHLHDLENAGIIEARDRTFAPKWKHYRVVAAKAEDRQVHPPIMSRSTAWRSGIIMVAVLLTAMGYLYLIGNSIYVPISITDPPQVPYGTQALYINYTSLSVHVVGKAGSYWMPVNANGSLDLMGLINESEVIGSARIPSGSSINTIRFNISSASIVINNSTHPVSLAEDNIYAMVQSNRSFNSTTGVLLELSPVVIEQNMMNSTSFLLLPSARAALMPSPAGLSGSGINSLVYMHARYPLRSGYSDAFFGREANITVKSAKLQQHGNSTMLDVSLYNGGPGNVIVYGVVLGENGDVFTNSMLGNNGILQGYSVGASGYGGGDWVVKQVNGSVVINSTNLERDMPYLRNGSMLVSLKTPVNNIIITRSGGSMPLRQWASGPVQELNHTMFVVYGNGTMIQVNRDYNRRLLSAQAGYMLSSMGSITLSYNGTALVDGEAITNQNQYSIAVITGQGLVVANVTQVT